MRDAKLGTTQSEEHKTKRINKISNLKRNKDTREKMSKSASIPKPHIRKKILQYDLEGNFIKEWESLTQASSSFNRTTGSISECCHGKRKKAHGYIWKYKEN